MSDFLEKNSAFFLSLAAMLGACFGVLLQYLRASRCRTIKCCGMECERDVLPPDQAMVDTSAVEMRSSGP